MSHQRTLNLQLGYLYSNVAKAKLAARCAVRISYKEL
jgi:hypothetical protein